MLGLTISMFRHEWTLLAGCQPDGLFMSAKLPRAHFLLVSQVIEARSADRWRSRSYVFLRLMPDCSRG